GLYLSVKDNRRSMRRVYLTGLALGAACMVKYVAVFEAPIPLAILMIKANHSAIVRTNHKYIYNYKECLFVLLEYTVGIATPVFIISAFYIASGHLTDFIDASLRSNFRRLEVPFSFKVASMALHDEARVWPVLNLATLISLIWSVGQTIKRVRLDTSPHERTTFIFLLFWVLGTAIGVSSAKSFFPHYFLQMLPALSVTTAWVLSRIFSFESTATIWRYLLALSFILIQPVLTAKDRVDRVMLAINENTIDGIGMLHDVPAKIAANIKPILGENSNKTIYVVDYEPVIYSLAGIAPPTKYAFPPFLVQPPLSYVAGVDPILEVKAILAKCPVFIIRASRRPPGANNEGVYEFIDHAIARDYETWLIYDEATIYRRRADR
ncbi:MAG: glycosyl transferase family 39, partial [Rhodospirillales bacterium]|nr:glycosyl transferase family 39 [Rhodospirillales bacterium]